MICTKAGADRNTATTTVAIRIYNCSTPNYVSLFRLLMGASGGVRPFDEINMRLQRMFLNALNRKNRLVSARSRTSFFAFQTRGSHPREKPLTGRDLDETSKLHSGKNTQIHRVAPDSHPPFSGSHLPQAPKIDAKPNRAFPLDYTPRCDRDEIRNRLLAMKDTAAASRTPIDGRSHVIGLREPPLIEKTIPGILAETCQAHPDREAAVFRAQNIRKSYSAFRDDVDRLATGLLSVGLSTGDRLGIWSPNRYEWLLTQFATARIGVILVNVNPAYRSHELTYALNLVGCRALITAQRFKSSDYIDMLNAVRDDIPTEILIALGEDTPEGFLSFDSLLLNPSSKLDEITASLRPNDPINIQFTSGTTGNPKGATLTHRNIINNAFFTTDAMEFTPEDRLCIPVPFYHCFGMVMGTLGCVTRGATIVVPGEGFDPLETLSTVSEERCTALYGVPTMFVGMLEHPDFAQYDLSTLRTGIMAGAPCPIEVMRAVQAKMHMKGVTIAYGMTETSPVSFQSNLDDPLEKRVTSVGRIHPHVEVKIVAEDGAPMPVGEQGELWTRGYSVMKGYWGDDARTAEAIDGDGWMHTGDLARMDDEGYVNITGRLKDMVVRGGENIYPREIEEFLYTHPSVSQVQVFGIPDEKFGEITCAWIIAKPDAEQDPEHVRAFCKDRIAHYKVPTHIRFVEEIPMTVTGKPQKFLMRDAMVKELGLTEQDTA